MPKYLVTVVTEWQVEADGRDMDDAINKVVAFMEPSSDNITQENFYAEKIANALLRLDR